MKKNLIRIANNGIMTPWNNRPKVTVQTLTNDKSNKESDSESDSENNADDSQEAREYELNNIKPQKYNPKRDWRLDGSYLVVGKRRFGKTTCLRSILADVGDYYPSGVYVFSKTKHNKFWSQHVPEERIYDHMDWEAVDQILADQKKKRKEREQTGTQDSLPYVLFILDDMISARNDMRYVEKMLNLFFEGRHYDISIAICAQDVKGIPPDIRQNVDQVFMTFQTQTRQLKTLREDYADFGWANNNVFPQFVRKYTTDHNILIIDQAEAKKNVGDSFYIYKPDPEPEPYRLGDYDFWYDSGCDWHEQMRIYKNVEKTALDGKIDNEKIQKLYAQQWKRSKKMEKLYKNFEASSATGDNGRGLYKTANIFAASPQDQMNFMAETKKKMYEASAEKQAQKDMDELYKMYTPAKRIYDNKK